MAEQKKKSAELAPAVRIQHLVTQDSIKRRFESMLGKRAPAFLSSIISVTTGNEYLQKCDPMTIVAAAAIAASLDLPINPSLGLAYIVPYKDVAQFQIGYRGLIQLAMRSGRIPR